STIVLADTPVTITDPLLPSATISCTLPADGVLSPGESYGCSAPFTPTQAQFEGGDIVNTARAEFTYTPPDGSPAVIRSPEASVTLDVFAPPVFTLTKTGPENYSSLGETLTYTL